MPGFFFFKKICLFHVIVTLSRLLLFGRERQDKNVLNNIYGRLSPLSPEGRDPGWGGGVERGASAFLKSGPTFFHMLGAGWLVGIKQGGLFGKWHKTGLSFKKWVLGGLHNQAV